MSSFLLRLDLNLGVGGFWFVCEFGWLFSISVIILFCFFEVYIVAILRKWKKIVKNDSRGGDKKLLKNEKVVNLDDNMLFMSFD